MRQRGFVPVGLILYAVAGIAIIAAVWAFHNHGVKQGRAEIQTKWDKANKDQRDAEAKKSAKASTKLEKSNVKARIVTRTVTEYVDRVVERPIYRNVCLDADGLCIARAAIRGESADTCKPDKPVSYTSGSGGWNGKVSLAMDYRDISPIP